MATGAAVACHHYLMMNAAVAPWAHDGGTTGIVLCHGFTGSPASMRPWAEYMAAQGASVRLPLLPGHGTSWQDMATSTQHDWMGAIRAAHAELAARCDRVFAFGLSMGGTLALRLAEEVGDGVAGVVVVNPMVSRMPAGSAFAPLLHRLMPSLPSVGNDISKQGVDEHCYTRVPVRCVGELTQLARDVVRNIASVTQPVLIFTSTQDHLVDPRNSQWLAEHLTSDDVSSVILENSFHVATLDNDADRIFEVTANFVRRLAG